MTEDLDLRRALGDVRKAYRLVYAYQKRISDLLAVFADEANRIGLFFEQWYPYAFSRPSRSGTEFYRSGNWTWDFFPGYLLAVVFESRHSRKHGTRALELIVSTDGGFRAVSGEPDVEDFSPADECDSTIRLRMWKFEGTSDCWDAADDAFGDGVPAGQERTESFEGVTVHFLHREVRLADLPDAGAVRDRLFGPVAEYLPAPT